jgi:hypothetical protein
VCRVLRLPWRVPAVAWAELSVLLLCVRDGRALFLVSPLLSPFPLFFFKPFSVEFFGFRVDRRKIEEKISQKFFWGFLNFARNLIFGRNWFFYEEELIKSSESSVVCEPPNFVFLLLLLLVDSHGNNNFWFEYFVGSWKFTTFFILFRGRENFVLRLCCSRCVREWTNNLSRKKQLQLFGVLCLSSSCVQYLSVGLIWMRRNSFSRLAG